jgi:mono/diheme cytochrome c family protein
LSDTTFGRRNAFRLPISVCVFALGVLMVVLLRVVAAQESPAKQSVWAGVYSDDQARRGEAQYDRNCQACHGADLSGNPVDEVPALAWEGFLTQWNNRTVKDLFDTVKRSMPKDSPGSLNSRAYVDVIAYLLQANKFPSGSKDLSLNTDALAQIVIEKDKP